MLCKLNKIKKKEKKRKIFVIHLTKRSIFF